MMRQGRDPTDYIQRQIARCEAWADVQAEMRQGLDSAESEVPYAQVAANIFRTMEKQFQDNLGDAMPYDELRRSPAWLDTVSKLRDAQRNQDFDSVLTCHRLLERLAKADDDYWAMVARQHRIAVHVGETNKVFRRAQLFLDVTGTRRSDILRLRGLNRTEVEEVVRRARRFIEDSGIHPSDYRRLMALERALERTKANEMLRQVLEAIDADLHRLDDDLNRAGDLDAADDAEADEMLRQLLEAIDADLQSIDDDLNRAGDLNRTGDLEAPDGAPVRNRLNAYWEPRLDTILEEVSEPIDGQADAVSGSVRTSATGAAGSIEDATPPVARVLEGVETPPAGRTGGSDDTPALYRIHLQHLDQAGTTEGRRTRFHPHWGATVTEIPYSQDESVRLFYRNQRQQVMGSNRTLPLRFGSATGFLLPGFGIEEMKGLKSFCHRKNLRVDLLSGQNYARYLAETEELHQVSEAGRWFEHGALYPAELAELWERRPGRTVTARHVPKAPWLMFQADEDE